MRVALRKFVPAALLCAALPCLAATHHKSSKHATVKHASAATAAGMAPERATQIQQALIKQGYLTGDPSGHWDTTSVAAMQKFQSDNGWQTKYTPDARALIKLGLGGSNLTQTSSMQEIPATPGGE